MLKLIIDYLQALESSNVLVIPSWDELSLSGDRVQFAHRTKALGIEQSPFYTFIPTVGGDGFIERESVVSQFRIIQQMLFAEFGSTEMVVTANWSRNEDSTFFINDNDTQNSISQMVDWIADNSKSPFSNLNNKLISFHCQMETSSIPMQKFRCYFFHQELSHIYCTMHGIELEIIPNKSYIFFDEEQQLYGVTDDRKGPLANQLRKFIMNVYNVLAKDLDVFNGFNIISFSKSILILFFVWIYVCK